MILSQCPPLSGLQFPHVGGGGWRVVSLGLVIQKGLCHGRRGKWGWGVGIHRAGVWRGQRGDEGSRGCPSHGEPPTQPGPSFLPPLPGHQLQPEALGASLTGPSLSPQTPRTAQAVSPQGGRSRKGRAPASGQVHSVEKAGRTWGDAPP